MLVFRDGRRRVRARRMVEALASSLQVVAASPSPPALIAALLRAGELESSLADEGAESPAISLPADCLAEALVCGLRVPSELELVAHLETQSLPDLVSVSPQEGFAYYALHPLDYAELVDRLPDERSTVVIGIRSIGTTLSAVVAAACRRRGQQVPRFTVRPAGHPWDRHTEFAPAQRELIAARAAESDFLVVDEGPGLSGSSFLSVAEALERAGVAPGRITLLCSHAPDLHRLCAPRAAERWQRYRWLAAGPTRHLPSDCGVDISAGNWRRAFIPEEQDWPASWTSMERMKFLSRDRRHLLKFEGHGAAGEAIFDRAQHLHAAGFGPAARDSGHGFVRYDLLPGPPLRLSDLDHDLLGHLARYCARRAAAFPGDAEPTPLQELVRVNSLEEFGNEFVGELPERLVIADGRMQPHEWVRDASGRALKTDAAGHGDDHFYPGPTDIAWDLAGTIVEWQLDPAATSYFLQSYATLTGDLPQRRLPAWLRAYTLFRLGYCRMAADALAGTPEEPRLRRAHARYRTLAQQFSPAAIAA